MAITKATASSIAPAAKGDLVVGSATNDAAVLAVGTNNTVLTADSSTATGLKWATPAAGGMTLINTGGTALNTTTTVISSIPSGYNSLRIITVVTDPQDDGGGLRLRINEDSTANRHAQGFMGATSNVQFNQTSVPITYSQDNGTPNGITITDIVFYDNTSIWKFATNFGVVNSYLDNARAEFIQTWGAYNQTGAVTSLEFFFNGGVNASGGTVYVYGVK
jgi:hypothetical protein